jgi:hypothetical protein
MTEPQMGDLIAWGERVNDIAARLVKEQPGIHPITAHVIAGDILSGERATAEVNAGMEPTKAYALVGSYARWGWVITMLSQERITWDWFVENICDLWRGSDPDDTNATYLALWQKVRDLKGGYVRDGRPLPKGKLLRVYRGITSEAGAKGFAWTTDPKIAQKFASGAGERREVKGGAVIAGFVARHNVLAYITERGESEVIVDPAFILDPTISRA